ncbi:CaiB/BaiF CoA transferase family protein [Aquabacter spiritensis]|uniref:Crotonobetainyl-CoA:carnitine CoA-transferase CaiB-like acyl-CoA transferase n=1 Tax=Aquabacter spiritensis TaxID=933073 RepID=A0A4R3M4W1_9HYPH|nr:CaiB/BaiF CoA-transferase family protein [Aquabacter spiritensis]TCT06235.1 crotonobetainyl-CoA:carnitine CoA-transferase CaiB-like acyl-CoA transferase [Aquabacter spiritensis]
MQPLAGVLVLDFSTLLPGPLASLVLAEAGAQVVKIERPGRGDEMRSYPPLVGADGVNFHMLNRGKRSLALDLKAPDAVAQLTPLLEKADILIEQFRPGVMDRLGLGYAAVKALNPGIVYCSITGWGQTGPKAAVAAHDLNYMAEAGVLGLSAGADGAPVLPPVLAADIAGGTYPALMNILMALRLKERTGTGAHLDIAMADNLFSFVYWGLGSGFAAGAWPKSGRDLVTGGSPRYQIYRTKDGRHLAAAPLEDKFWETFCAIVDLAVPLRDPAAPADAVIAEVAAKIAAQTSDHWRAAFAGKDVCCSIVATLEEAVADPHFAARGVFAQRLALGEAGIPALPVPVVPAFRTSTDAAAPALGEAGTPNDLI